MFRDLSIDRWKKIQRKNETERNNHLILFSSSLLSLYWILSLCILGLYKNRDAVGGNVSRFRTWWKNAWQVSNSFGFCGFHGTHVASRFSLLFPWWEKYRKSDVYRMDERKDSGFRGKNFNLSCCLVSPFFLCLLSLFHSLSLSISLSLSLSLCMLKTRHSPGTARFFSLKLYQRHPVLSCMKDVDCKISAPHQRT